MTYRNPTCFEVASPLFNAIWGVIKKWDIGVDDEYAGYCNATGNHVCAIMDAVEELIGKETIDMKCGDINQSSQTKGSDV